MCLHRTFFFRTYHRRNTLESTLDISRLDTVEFTENQTIISMNATLRTGYVNESLIQNATLSTDYVNQALNQAVTMPTEYLNQTESLFSKADIPLPIMTYILFGLVCFITILGLFGNSLILTIMIKYRESPLKGHDILIIALALFDGIVLIPTVLSHPSVYEVIGRDIRATTTVGCKLITGIRLSASISSFTVVVIICIERFIAVLFPLRSIYILSRKLLLLSLLISVLTVFILYMTMCVLYSEIVDGKCDSNIAGTLYSSVLNKIPDTTIYNRMLGAHLMLYLLILFTFTTMIIAKLFKERLIRRRLTSTELDVGHYRTTVKLISVVVVFVVLAALPGVSLTVMDLNGIQLTDTSQTIPSWLMLARLLNHSTNFLLYNTFDTTFRKNALSLFHFDNEKRPLVGLNARAEAETSFNEREI